MNSVIIANRQGEERGVRYSGRSAIFLPDGKILECRKEHPLVTLAINSQEIDAWRETREKIHPGGTKSHESTFESL